MKVSDIRELITATLHDLGLNAARPTGEHLLTKEHFYLGCRFDFEGASAIWLEEAGQVRFFGNSGELIKIIKVNASSADVVAKQAV